MEVLLYSCLSITYQHIYLNVSKSGLSTGIGIYHGCIRSRQMTTKEFLIADGRMGVKSSIFYVQLRNFACRFYRLP